VDLAGSVENPMIRFYGHSGEPLGPITTGNLSFDCTLRISPSSNVYVRQ
jgi:hypothetical protein